MPAHRAATEIESLRGCDLPYKVSTGPRKKGDAMKSSLRILNLEDSANDAELNEAMISARWPQSQFVRVDSRQAFVDALEQGGFDLPTPFMLAN